MLYRPLRDRQMVARPFAVSGAVLLFPITYIFGDVFTEVYGFAASRRAIWLGFFGTALLYLMGAVVIALPSAPGWQNQQAFAAVFGFIPRILAASLIAFWAGEFANSYTMARLKLFTNGRKLWTRTIGSTLVGQAVDTTLVVTLTFAGRYPVHILINTILTGYFLKVGYEIIATPITYLVINWLKRAECPSTATKTSTLFLSQTRILSTSGSLPAGAADCHPNPVKFPCGRNECEPFIVLHHLLITSGETRGFHACPFGVAANWSRHHRSLFVVFKEKHLSQILRTPHLLSRIACTLGCAVVLFAMGCKSDRPPAPPPQAMPVQVAPVTLSPSSHGDTYVATIKSRRSATMQPQVDGNITKILVKSGDVVKAGQVLMQIDPLKQVATVQSQQGTEAAAEGRLPIQPDRRRPPASSL